VETLIAWSWLSACAAPSERLSSGGAEPVPASGAADASTPEPETFDRYPREVGLTDGGAAEELPPPGEAPPTPEPTTTEAAELIKADLVVVDSAERELILFSGGRELRRFPVELGRLGVGKRQHGDLRTPRGRYRLLQAVPSPRFGHFIPVSYPNAEDLRRGFSRRLITREERDTMLATIHQGGLPSQDTGLGGHIGVHAPVEPAGGPEPSSLPQTQGCIVMRAADLEIFLELYEPGVSFEIR